MTAQRKLMIAVVGPNTCSDDEAELGRLVGKGIAEQGWTLLCGGLGGMMEASARGAKDAGGNTVGILPGNDADAANASIAIALPTGLGAFRNMLIVQAADAVIAIRGQYGTLSEIAFALRLGKPVIGLKTWCLSQDGEIDRGIVEAVSPEDAIEKTLTAIG